MAKSRDAFRTISEVSDLMETPAHVLRFWESKFKQIKPVKRAGGRRYYRPDDVALLVGIKHLLHDQGMTIKGAQKLLREQGVKHVIAIGEGVDAPEQTMAQTAKAAPEPEATAQAVADVVKNAGSEQAEMFDESNKVAEPDQPVETTPEETVPKLQIISAKPVAEAAPEAKSATVADKSPEAEPDNALSALSPFAKPSPKLPDNPAPRTDVTARCLASATRAKSERVKQNATEIAPLLSRLISLRDEMRHPW